VRAERKTAALAFVAWTLRAITAGAHCRTTTCDVGNPDSTCHEGIAGCTPISWQNGCTWFGVQEDGSKKLGISHDTLHARVAQAFANWAAIDCGGGLHPAFAIQDTDALYGDAGCDEAEFTKQDAGLRANADVWMFRDDGWPYTGSTTTIALTTVTVDLTLGSNYGRILDADVEINSFGNAIVTTPIAPAGAAALDAIVAHESGHFLGLAHSQSETSTMYAYYDPKGARASLTSDDTEALCGVYAGAASAPSCPEPEPIFGFSKYCGGTDPSTKPETASGGSHGCSVGQGQDARLPMWSVLLGVGVIAARRRSLRRRTTS
jgi:MYXO-CTERM domain-containing protein